MKITITAICCLFILINVYCIFYRKINIKIMYGVVNAILYALFIVNSNAIEMILITIIMNILMLGCKDVNFKKMSFFLFVSSIAIEIYSVLLVLGIVEVKDYGSYIISSHITDIYMIAASGMLLISDLNLYKKYTAFFDKLKSYLCVAIIVVLGLGALLLSVAGAYTIKKNDEVKSEYCIIRYAAEPDYVLQVKNGKIGYNYYTGKNKQKFIISDCGNEYSKIEQNQKTLGVIDNQEDLYMFDSSQADEMRWELVQFEDGTGIILASTDKMITVNPDIKTVELTEWQASVTQRFIIDEVKESELLSVAKEFYRQNADNINWVYVVFSVIISVYAMIKNNLFIGKNK